MFNNKKMGRCVRSCSCCVIYVRLLLALVVVGGGCFCFYMNVPNCDERISKLFRLIVPALLKRHLRANCPKRQNFRCQNARIFEYICVRHAIFTAVTHTYAVLRTTRTYKKLSPHPWGCFFNQRERGRIESVAA